jgi:autotransporter-associated beta strand protein
MRSPFVSAVGPLAGMLCALCYSFALSRHAALANTSSPPVLGIDVFNGNGTMNWSQIASNGIQFAWAKATQGNYYQDAQLQNNESGGTSNGVYIGAYDFADPTRCSPLTEATYFVNYASQYGAFNTGKLLPALDMESVGSSINGAANLTAWINDWAADVYNLSGVHPFLYCSPGFISGHSIASTGVPLWEADWTYPTNLSNTRPPSNSWSPWSTWTFWQYSDKGSVGGDPSTVDLDAFNGTLSQMVASQVIPALAWTGNVNGTWNLTSSGNQNWNYGTSASNAAYYFDGRAVVFPDTNLVTNGQVAHSSVSISSVVAPQSMEFTANSVNYTFTGAAIAGVGGMTLNGAGTVTLNNGTSAGPNTFSGPVAVNKGQLVLEQPWSLGNAVSAAVASGGALALNNTSGSAVSFGNLATGGGTIPLAIAGSGLSANPAGAIDSTHGNNTYTGAIALSANAKINSASTVLGDGLLLSGPIATNGHTLTFSGAGTTTVGGAIAGGALAVSGAGTVTLASASSLTGPVQINGGTLKITNGSALGAAAITLGGGKLSLAAPAMIGVNIAADAGTVGSSSGEQPEQMGAAAIAGVGPVAMSKWNDFIITRFANGGDNSNLNPPAAQSVPTSPTPFTLNESTGRATTAQVIGWSGNNSYSVYGASQASANPNAQLINGILCGVNSNAFPNHPATLSIGNIPYTTGYSVYVYFNNNNAGQGAQISLQSGNYASPTYYVAMLGMESTAASPFFISGTSSTTAGSYLPSNYVQIPVPASGVGGAMTQFTVTLTAAASGTNNNTPGIAAAEIVGASGATLTNSVAVNANSTIDVAGVKSAALGALSIGSNTLFVTGGSTGAGAPYGLTLGAATFNGNPTFDVANNGGGTGTLTLTSLSDGGAPRIMTKTNSGALEVQGAPNLSTNTALYVNAGTLRFNNTSGPAAIGSGATATVSGAATLELTGTVSALSSPAGPANRVDISNNSMASAGVLVSGWNQQVGRINGNGTTEVESGSSLTANCIVQNALVIGGGTNTPAVVAIDASDSAGNPLATSSIDALSSDMAFTFSLASSDSLNAGISSSGMDADFATIGLNTDGSSAAGRVSVPEPNALALVLLGSLALGAPSLWRQAAPRS